LEAARCRASEGWVGYGGVPQDHQSMASQGRVRKMHHLFVLNDLCDEIPGVEQVSYDGHAHTQD